MTVADLIEAIGSWVDLVGVGLLSIRRLVRGADDACRRYRQDIGRAILLGLEVLVAADIIRTVAVTPTLLSVAVLAGIVLIRTFLSFSLEVELEGRWPWRRSPAHQGDRQHGE